MNSLPQILGWFIVIFICPVTPNYDLVIAIYPCSYGATGYVTTFLTYQ